MTALDPLPDPESAKELNAVLRARKELGPDYEPELIDSFLDTVGRRLDSRIERRVRRAVAEQQAAHPHVRGGRRGAGLAPMSLALAVPLSAIAGGTAHLAGMLVAWAGIVAVNVAHSVSLAGRGWRDREDRRRTGAPDWE